MQDRTSATERTLLDFAYGATTIRQMAFEHSEPLAQIGKSECVEEDYGIGGYGVSISLCGEAALGINAVFLLDYEDSPSVADKAAPFGSSSKIGVLEAGFEYGIFTGASASVDIDVFVARAGIEGGMTLLRLTSEPKAHIEVGPN